ncbi:hypothetical protein BC827DRAFT_1256230 [Russula dissimulans]|nr:hypothetical protein BC827DRAFT_1256230 [Russula dissimulans]
MRIEMRMNVRRVMKETRWRRKVKGLTSPRRKKRTTQKSPPTMGQQRGAKDVHLHLPPPVQTTPLCSSRLDITLKLPTQTQKPLDAPLYSQGPRLQQ